MKRIKTLVAFMLTALVLTAVMAIAGCDEGHGHDRGHGDHRPSHHSER